HRRAVQQGRLGLREARQKELVERAIPTRDVDVAKMLVLRSREHRTDHAILPEALRLALLLAVQPIVDERGVEPVLVGGLLGQSLRQIIQSCLLSESWTPAQ